MSVDLADKKIIMIHGVAGKPPENDWKGLWKRSIVENVICIDDELGYDLDSSTDVFMSAYWCLKENDDEDYVKGLTVQIKKLIGERQQSPGDFKIDDARSRFLAKEQRLGKESLDRARSVDDLADKYPEAQLYKDDQVIADYMRLPLENALREAWRANCDVALLSHSMGTFIAYDVLWRFAHLNAPGFGPEFSGKRIQLFVTMGSPLGYGIIQDLIFPHPRPELPLEKGHFPANIDRWQNYACIGDFIAARHDDLDKKFIQPMKNFGLLPGMPPDEPTSFPDLYNPYEPVETEENKYVAYRHNPHKSYGYLVQAKLGTSIVEFLRGSSRP